MTNEEAIEGLKDYCNCDCHIYGSDYCHGDCAYYIAIKALEKQIPKKPVKGNVYWACPNCGHERPIQRKCCDYCGQAIDWSDK